MQDVSIDQVLLGGLNATTDIQGILKMLCNSAKTLQKEIEELRKQNEELKKENESLRIRD
jgi:FtsZ-binding cell division protein ZapB